MPVPEATAKNLDKLTGIVLGISRRKGIDVNVALAVDNQADILAPVFFIVV